MCDVTKDNTQTTQNSLVWGRLVAGGEERPLKSSRYESMEPHSLSGRSKRASLPPLGLTINLTVGHVSDSLQELSPHRI